jgi:hypothetical protein
MREVHDNMKLAFQFDMDNIRSDLREIGWAGVDWMHLAQDRDEWTR